MRLHTPHTPKHIFTLKKFVRFVILAQSSQKSITFARMQAWIVENVIFDKKKTSPQKLRTVTRILPEPPESSEFLH